MNPTIVLVLLLLAVPLQLFINHYLEQSYSVEESGDLDGARLNALQRLGSSVMSFKHQFGTTLKHYSSWNNLRELFFIPRKKTIHISTFKTGSGNKIKIVTKSASKQSAPKTKTEPNTSSQRNAKLNTLTKQSSKSTTQKGPIPAKEAPTSRAKEVEDYMMKEVYFAQSKEPRTKRPSNVHFVVGQVVKHKMDGYHGVIIGWDPVAKAPDWWIERFFAKERAHVISTPHYHILVDSHYDASGTPYHYIPAEDLEAMGTGVQVSAPEVAHFFEGFKDGKHIPRPWLRDRYPLD